MTNAEQWLSDLEAKAKAATPGPWEKMFETAVGTGNGHQVPLCIASTNFESDAPTSPPTPLTWFALQSTNCCGCGRKTEG